MTLAWLSRAVAGTRSESNAARRSSLDIAPIPSDARSSVRITAEASRNQYPRASRASLLNGTTMTAGRAVVDACA
jgi:hypothetical protein